MVCHEREENQIIGMKNFLRAIGKIIRTARLSQGRTQMDLEFMCNDTDYSQINRMELRACLKSALWVLYLKGIARRLR